MGRIRVRRLRVFFGFPFLLFLLSPKGGTRPPSLETLKRDLARNFLDPRAHFRFAKALIDRGRRADAFLVMEFARREVFARRKKDFRWAHREVFFGEDPFDNSPEAERRLLEALKGAPRDPKLLFKIADVYISRREWRKAEAWLRKLIAVQPEKIANVEALKAVLARSGRPAAGRAVLEEWLKKHRDTADALLYKRESLPKGSAERIALLEMGLEKFPKNGWIPFYLALEIQGKDPGRAERLFRKAAKLEPKEPAIQGWTGRFLLKARKKPADALAYYYRAYFLDPDFYDTEYAEYRIQKLERERAGALLEKMRKDGTPAIEMVRRGDPFLAMAALRAMWGGRPPLEPTREEVDLAEGLLRRVAPDLQMFGARLLSRWNTDLVKKRVRKLLKDRDPFVKSLAVLPALKLLGKEGLRTAEKRLRSKWGLFWYDALTGLVRLGGKEGRKILEAHMEKETRREVLDLWQAVLWEGKKR